MKPIHAGLILLTLMLSSQLGQLDIVREPIIRSLVTAPANPPFVMQHHLDDYFIDSSLTDYWVTQWYESLSPTARIGQLIMPAWDTATSQIEISNLIEQEIIGGFMILRKDLTPDQLKAVQQKNPYAVPLLIASDAEPSLLKYRFNDPVFSGETGDLKTPQEVIDTSNLISEVLKEYEINLNFAPVYDNNQNQSVIGARSFGADASSIVPRANLLAQNFKDRNIIPTAKHFPGHGTVTGDTHLSLQSIRGPLTEIPQFVAAINKNIPVMMIGHLAVENNNYDTEGLPATLASIIMKTLLRDELGFRGVVITDAMNMSAVSNIEDSSLKSLVAGTDIVLMPTDPVALNAQILERTNNDPQFAEDIQAKVKRVLRLKFVWALSLKTE